MEQTKNCHLKEVHLRRVINLGNFENITVEAFFEVSQANPVSLENAIAEIYPQLEQECKGIKESHKRSKQPKSKVNDNPVDTDANPF